jgi:hypothetical protein
MPQISHTRRLHQGVDDKPNGRNNMANTSRRNGRPASCENCRRSKHRCDHTRPVCARCQHRGLVSSCFYHPAPLTRPRGLRALGEAQGGMVDFGTVNTHLPQEDAPNQSKRQSDQSPATLPWPSVASDAHHPGFRLQGLGASDEAIRAEHVAVVAEMLFHLRDLDMIENLLNEYYQHSPAALVPGPLVLPALSALQTCFAGFVSFSEQGKDGITGTYLQLAEKVGQSTSTNIDIDLESTPSSFCASYAGAPLRLEAVGLVFALAGRSCLLGPGRGDDRRDDFVHSMFRCSTCCLQIVREVAPQINDPTVWLAYENLLLTTSIQGDASKSYNGRAYIYRVDRGNWLTQFAPHCRPECMASTGRSSKRRVCSRSSPRDHPRRKNAILHL